ncbi:MAG: 3-hexulose-6-phosphate synthase [Lacrimispora sp.]|uniref:3-hexulose-6-phosphate synthase n=1 Tax=Lacrimispora sp. TaxID=2719234 RepID=UPI0039E36AB8
MKLQLALDDISLENAVKLVEEVHDYIDIIEIGTPMIIEYGMTPVRTMKEKFPQKEVLADLKIMDAGYYEAEEALKAGADYITVLGVTDNLTVQGSVDAAREYKGKAVVDMICVSDLESRIKKMEELGADFVSVHIGVDQQAAGRTPLDDLKIMKNTVRKAKISVAGGISVKTLPAYQEYGPDVIIVGSGITHASDPKAAAEEIHKALMRR